MILYFSVILPVYNVEKYLERCIQSVLKQDFSDYELILVDDGSTDYSSKLCDEFLSRYDFIKVIHKKNEGLSSARNIGLECAKGKYVLWFDSDDWIEDNTLSLIFNALSEQEADIVKFNHFRHIKESIPCFSNAKVGWYKNDKELKPLIDCVFYSAGEYGLSACMHAYKREFLINNKLNFESEREIGSEDFLFNIKAIINAKSILVMKEPLYHYDLRIGSLTQQYRENLPKKYTKLFVLLREYINEQNKTEQYYRKLCYFYVWYLMYGTCLVNEYNVTPEHTIKQRRTRVKEFLRLPEFQGAIKSCEVSKLTLKQFIQLYALKYKMEWLFYWLFVEKPKRK